MRIRGVAIVGGGRAVGCSTMMFISTVSINFSKLTLGDPLYFLSRLTVNYRVDNIFGGCGDSIWDVGITLRVQQQRHLVTCCRFSVNPIEISRYNNYHYLDTLHVLFQTDRNDYSLWQSCALSKAGKLERNFVSDRSIDQHNFQR
jgi:hypothetical protein